MSSRPINMRLTIVAVFAFLFIVALFLSPGGAAEQATTRITAVAEQQSAKRPAAITAVPARPVSPAWFSPEGEQGLLDPAPETLEDRAEPAPVPGDLPLVEAKPPPQGPDFPENS